MTLLSEIPFLQWLGSLLDGLLFLAAGAWIAFRETKKLEARMTAEKLSFEEVRDERAKLEKLRWCGGGLMVVGAFRLVFELFG